MVLLSTAVLIAEAPFGRTLRGEESATDQAWKIIEANLAENNLEKHAQAIRVLALLPGDARAFKFVREAADSDKSDFRAAAASTLGAFHTKAARDMLHKLVDDKEPSVALAAASALIASKDPEAYDAYYEFLTGERKAHPGLIATQMKTLHDPKKLAQIGIEQGIGFIPYAGIGLEAFRTLHTDDVSPVRAAAAKQLANDPDPQTGQALVNTAFDKSWLVRGASLEAIARRGDPSLLQSIVPAMMDDNVSVRCTAAAAVIRLSTLAARAKPKPPAAAAPDNPALAAPTPPAKPPR